MKRVLPLTREVGTPSYWRGLDHLAEHPEVKALLAREFPDGASTLDAPTRRTFLTLMGASLAMMGVTGCVRRPEEKIIPYAKAPEGVIPGVPQFYATSLSLYGDPQGVVVESHGGRPTKIEGNPEHPTTLGGTLPWLQASVLELYDPDRAQTPTKDGQPANFDLVRDAFDAALAKAQSNRGATLRVLATTAHSPSRARMKAALLAKYPQARFDEYDAVSIHEPLAGAHVAFGHGMRPVFAYDKASVVVALDADLFLTEPGAIRTNKLFARGRRVRRPTDEMNRLYVAEPAFTSAGMMADHRIRVPAVAVEDVLSALGAELVKRGVAFGALAAKLQPSPDIDARWVTAAAADLLRARGAGVVVAGVRQPASVHALAYAINHALGNIGKTVRFAAPGHRPEKGDGAEGAEHFAETAEQGKERKGQAEARRVAMEMGKSMASPALRLRTLVEEMNRGAVETLVILGGNPVYDAPGDLDLRTALGKVPTRLHLSSHHDETSSLCNLTLPRAHDLEAWGDAYASDGTFSLVQPLIAPMFQGLSDIELLARLAGLREVRGYDVVRETFRDVVARSPADALETPHVATAAASASASAPVASSAAPAASSAPLASPKTAGVVALTAFERAWRRALHDGFLVQASPTFVSPAVDFDAVAAVVGKQHGVRPSLASLEVTFAPDAAVFDGRFANVAWLQELPNNVTKMTWDNAAWLSVKTATDLGVASGDVMRLSVGGRTLDVPAWIVPWYG